MRHKKLKLNGILLLNLGLTGIMAQNALPSTGGISSGSGGSAAYTVGQVAYSNLSGSSGSASQGVKQAYEIQVVTGIDAAKDFSLQCIVFPNPTQDYLILKVPVVATDLLKSMSFQLLNNNGTYLELQKIVSNETTLNTSHLLTGIYYLKVVQLLENGTKREMKTFKIIKK